MDVKNWEEQRNLSNVIDWMATERNIYITAKKTRAPDNQRLSSTRLRLVFAIVHRTRSDTDLPGHEAQIVCGCVDFDYSLDRFAYTDEPRGLVASMFSDERIHFSFDGERGQSLQWKDLVTDNEETAERVPLQDFDDVVTRVSEAAARVAREALTAGRRAVEMAVTIDKRTVVPHQFEGLIPHRVKMYDRLWDHENPELYMEINLHYYIESLILFIVAPSADTWSRPFPRRLDYNQRGSTGTIERSPVQLEAEVSQSVPAATSAVEALERFRYERCNAENESEPLSCVICREEVLSGSRVTRMPCCHLYHSDCISKWLHEDHNCPICRFKLPTQ